MAQNNYPTPTHPINPGTRTLNEHSDLAKNEPWVLAPSDFAFLFDECKHCFWMKVVAGRPRPRPPFPKVFMSIDRAMKHRFVSQRTEAIDPTLPPGTITLGRRIRSKPQTVPGATRPVVIRGETDAILEYDDGSIAVLDFKTSPPNTDHVALYSRQLHGYALALEQPAGGPARRVKGLELLSFLPDRFETNTDGAALRGDVELLNVTLDRSGFEGFLTEVVAVLEEPTAPESSRSCPWCRWERTGQELDSSDAISGRGTDSGSSASLPKDSPSLVTSSSTTIASEESRPGDLHQDRADRISVIGRCAVVNCPRAATQHITVTSRGINGAGAVCDQHAKLTRLGAFLGQLVA
jgi:hypothetical protein